jgi:transposase
VSVIEKSEILSLVAGSGLPRRRALAQLGLAKSTYYRWLKRQTGGKLQDRKGGSPIPWNKLRPEEEETILVLARTFPELSSRELALRIVDAEGLYVSESTVFRTLKREGLVKPAEIVGFKAGKEYHRKTKRVNELWATDCSHIKVMDWGWYYLVTVMDDYSRFILAWELKSDMASNSLIDVGTEGGRRYWHDRCAGGGPDNASLRQWTRVHLPAVRGLLKAGRNQAHLSLSISSTDQRKDREIPPYYQRRVKPHAIRDAR